MLGYVIGNVFECYSAQFSLNNDCFFNVLNSSLTFFTKKGKAISNHILAFFVYIYIARKLNNFRMKTILLTHIIILLLLAPNISRSQVITITGYVNNQLNGKALENVSIYEENSGIGTITNQNGFYKLILPEGDMELKISDNGFKDYSEHFEIKSDTTLMVKLQPEVSSKHRDKKNHQLEAKAKNQKKSSRTGFKLF